VGGVFWKVKVKNRNKDGERRALRGPGILGDWEGDAKAPGSPKNAMLIYKPTTAVATNLIPEFCTLG